LGVADDERGDAVREGFRFVVLMGGDT
jgi:hypothetical protein